MGIGARFVQDHRFGAALNHIHHWSQAINMYYYQESEDDQCEELDQQRKEGTKIDVFFFRKERAVSTSKDRNTSGRERESCCICLRFPLEKLYGRLVVIFTMSITDLIDR